MNRCTVCIMPEVEGHISLDNQGRCDVCNSYQHQIKEGAKQQVKGLEKLKEDVARVVNKSTQFDCIIGVSGGKDSLMTLYIAKEILKLNPLALFIDNGFSTSDMYKNIHNAVDKLVVELVVYRTNELKKIFRKLLISKKPIYYCRICHQLIDIYIRDIAQKHGISLIMGGYTKGQDYSKSEELFWIYDISDKNTIDELVKDNQFSQIVSMISDHAIYLYENYDSITQINPFHYIKYNEKKIINFIKKELKFKLPKMSWPLGSTNCLFNFVSQHLSVKNFGYSQHETELSSLVRSGELSRDRVLEIIEYPITKEHINMVLAILDLTYDQIV